MRVMQAVRARPEVGGIVMDVADPGNGLAAELA
jgi:hypothetical protein